MDQLRYGVLNENNEVVIIDTAIEWARWFEGNRERRRVAETFVDRIRVSTVFLGMNHGSDDWPLWFECMAFPYDGWGELDGRRYATWEEAQAGHDLMVERFERERVNAFKAVGRELPSPSGA